MAGILGGTDLLHGSRLANEPLVAPQARSHGLTEETFGEHEHADA
jgi:hypothetical protein